MEHPHPVHLGRLSIAALENLVLASEGSLKASRGEYLPLQVSLPGANSPSFVKEIPELIPLTPMNTWSISSSSTPSPMLTEEADMTEQLRALSETAMWYDNALFSPAVTVPRANTSNVDWYGGSLLRRSSLDFYTISPPLQIPASTAVSTSFGVLLPGHMPTSAKSLHALPGQFSNSLDRTNLNQPASSIHGTQIQPAFPASSLAQTVQLSTTLTYLNSADEQTPIHHNTPSLSEQTGYMSLLETHPVQAQYEPFINEPHHNPEDLRQIWATLFNCVGDGSVPWSNSILSGVALEEQHIIHASNGSFLTDSINGDGNLSGRLQSFTSLELVWGNGN